MYTHRSTWWHDCKREGRWNAKYEVKFEKDLRDRYPPPVLPSIRSCSRPKAHGLVLSGERALNTYCLVSVLSLVKVTFNFCAMAFTFSKNLKCRQHKLCNMNMRCKDQLFPCVPAFGTANDQTGSYGRGWFIICQWLLVDTGLCQNKFKSPSLHFPISVCHICLDQQKPWWWITFLMRLRPCNGTWI